MSMLHYFLRGKRVKLNRTHFVKGTVLAPDALAYQPVPTVADPPYDPRVARWRNFTSLQVLQPPMNYQNYVVPRGSQRGFQWQGADPDGLVTLAQAYGVDLPSDVYG